MPHVLTLSSRRAFALATTAAFILTTMSFFGAAGAQEPTVVMDAETSGGPRITSGGPVVFNETRTFQLTNMTPQADRPVGSTFSLYGPDATAPVMTRASDSSGNGKMEVTFPNVFFGEVGTWTMTSADNESDFFFDVNFELDLIVELSVSSFPDTSSATMFTVRVTDSARGTPKAGVDINVMPYGTTGARTNASGEYVYVGPLPGPGTYAVEATFDFQGDSRPELGGSAYYTVTAAEEVTLVAREAGRVVTELPVRKASDAGTADVRAGAYALDLTITNASGGHPRGGGFELEDIIFNNKVLPGWSADSYDEATGTARLSGIVPTGAGDVTVTVNWSGRAHILILPAVQHNISSSQAEMVAGEMSDVTFHLADESGNPIPDGKIFLFRGQKGAYPGIPTTSLNGTGAPGAGKDGNYTFQITPGTKGRLTAYAETGREFNGTDNRAYSYLNIDVVPPTASLKLNMSNVLISSNTVPVTIHNVADLGTASVTLHYDPSRVEVVDVSPGDIPASTFVTHHDPARGTLRMLVVSSNVPGATGDFTLAHLTFRAGATLGVRSTLNLSVEEFTDAAGDALPYRVTNSTVILGLIGDITGDDLLSQLDVIAAGEYAIGVRDATGLRLELGDANLDGQVSGVDAMLIAQVLAGTRKEF